MHDGCWNPVSSGGVDPPKVNTPASGDEESLIMSIQTRATSSQVAEYDFTSFHNEAQTQKPKALIIQKHWDLLELYSLTAGSRSITK